MESLDTFSCSVEASIAFIGDIESVEILMIEKKSGSRPRFENSRGPRLSVEDLGILEALFTEKEVWEAKGEFSKGCNASFVTLVPKVDDPLGLGDYRPISLIGSYYKIISKLLAERVKKVIGNVIGEKKKQNDIVFKLDFEKAYDSIEWGFLMAIMKKIGFGNRWCKWVDSCLRFTSISILVNGSATREFSIERGVRQGDPLSPFLFILTAKGLYALMKEAISKSIFKGIRVGEYDVLVSHLQYANDTIIFGSVRGLGSEPMIGRYEVLVNEAMIGDSRRGPPPAGPIPQNPAPDIRTMEELLQAPTEGVGDAIVVTPQIGSQLNKGPRVLLHISIAQDMRERPLNESFKNDTLDLTEMFLQKLHA
ncbi:cysteine-rich receptor-like protein kinase [Tanacetum coccineum]